MKAEKLHNPEKMNELVQETVDRARELGYDADQVGLLLGGNSGEELTLIMADIKDGEVQSQVNGPAAVDMLCAALKALSLDCPEEGVGYIIRSVVGMLDGLPGVETHAMVDPHHMHGGGPEGGD